MSLLGHGRWVHPFSVFESFTGISDLIQLFTLLLYKPNTSFCHWGFLWLLPAADSCQLSALKSEATHVLPVTDLEFQKAHIPLNESQVIGKLPCFPMSGISFATEITLVRSGLVRSPSRKSSHGTAQPSTPHVCGLQKRVPFLAWFRAANLEFSLIGSAPPTWDCILFNTAYLIFYLFKKDSRCLQKQPTQLSASQ